MAKCPNCGVKMPDKSIKFCGFCGTNLKTGERTMADEMAEISKSKSKKNQKVNDELANYVPKAPVIDKNDSAKTETPKFKTSVATPVSNSDKSFNASFNAPSENSEEYVPKAPVIPQTDDAPKPRFKTSVVGSAPVTNSKPVSTAPVQLEDMEEYVPKAPVIPQTDDAPKPRFKTSVVGSAPVTNSKPVSTAPVQLEDMEEYVPKAPVIPQTDDAPKPRFKTSVVGSAPVTNSKPVSIPSAPADAFETGILEEEITHASPVQTISEVEQKLPEPPKNKIYNKEAQNAVDDMENAFSSLGKNKKQDDAKVTVSAPVPSKTGSYIGLDIKTARTLIERAGFSVEVSTKNDEKTAKNEVIAQSIPAGQEVSKDTVIKLTVSCGTWSSWSEKEPSSEGNEIETKTEYRTRTREKTIDHKTSTSSEVIKGYTLCDSKKGYGDWETEKYFTNNSKKTSEICELVENLIGFKYCGWFYKGKNPAIKNSFCTLETALYFNKDTKADEWEYQEKISYSNVKESVISWSPSESSSDTPAGDKIRSNIRMTAYRVDGMDYPLKYGSFETQWYKYKTRSMEGVTYYFEKEGYTEWSLWGKWSEKSEIATEFLDVETRVLYRSRTIADEK